MHVTCTFDRNMSASTMAKYMHVYTTKLIWPMLCYTHYVPHATPFSIVEVNGVRLGYAGLDWTWVQGFIIALYPSFYYLLLNPFHLE